MRVGFEGGPWDGDEMEGLMAQTLLSAPAAFFCLYADGRWEHYCRHDCDEHDLCYSWAGACNEIDGHPKRG